MTILRNESWLNWALIRPHLSPMIISSFLLTGMLSEGLAWFLCSSRRILCHISCKRGDCSELQMVFADRALIPFYNSEFIRDSQALPCSWQLPRGRPKQNKISWCFHLVLLSRGLSSTLQGWDICCSRFEVAVQMAVHLPMDREISTFIQVTVLKVDFCRPPLIL